MSRGNHENEDGAATTTTSGCNATTATSTESSTVQRYQIRFHASNLPRDLLKGPPDTFCVVTPVENARQPKATKYGTTEIVQKSQNPRWTKTICLEYAEGTEKVFLVNVMRVLHNDISKRESLGETDFEVSDMLKTHSRRKIKRLKDGKACIFCSLEPYQERSTALFRFQLSCVGLTVPQGGKLLRQSSAATDIVITLAVGRPDRSEDFWEPIYRSNQEPLSPEITWDPAEMDLESGYQSSLMLPVKVAILSVKRGGDTILGSVETSIRNLENLAASADDDGDNLQNLSSRGLKVLGLRGDKEIAKLRVKFAELNGPTASSSFMDDSSHGDRSRAGSLSQASTRLSGAMLPVNRNGRGSTDQDIVLEFASKIDLSSSQLTHSRRGSSDSTMDGDEVLVDPYAVDMATLPNRFSSTAPRMPTFQDYVVDGCELDLCVAIDFTSSNGDPRNPGSLHHQSKAVFNDYEETITSIGNAVSSYSSSKEFVVWGFGAKFNGIVRHLFQCGTAKSVKGVDGILEAYQSVFKSDITMSGPTVFVQAIQAAACRAKSHHACMNAALCYAVLLIITDGIMNDFEDTKRRLALYSELPLSVIFVGVGKADFRTMYDLCVPEQGMRRNTTFVEFRLHQHDPRSLGKAALEEIPSQLVAYMVQNGIFPIGSHDNR